MELLSDLLKEIKYRTSRSGGAGGQHVNKVSTKVELLFDVKKSIVLSDLEKSIILEKLSNRISQEGILLLQCDETRSQLKNKTIAAERLLKMLSIVLTPSKKRKKTKPSKSAIQKRLKDKKKLSDKKSNRRFKDE